MRTIKALVLACFAFCANSLRGQAPDSTTVDIDSAEFTQLIQYYEEAQAMDSALNYQRGTIGLSDGLATLELGENYKYLDPEEAQKIIVEAWGNPAQETLGMILPDSVNPYLYSGWGVIVYYEEDGYIKDEDARSIDYDELLETMQEEAVENNEARRAAGYSGYELKGWAEAPYYDMETKKLYWAKELMFDESEESTLNYDIRILGRKGFLQMNAVAGISQLDEVKVSMQDLLSRVEFSQGNTYFDFDPSVDEVAAYGIGALVAGKLAAKAGLLKVIGIFFLKFWKILLIAGAGLIAVIRRVWTGKEQREIT